MKTIELTVESLDQTADFTAAGLARAAVGAAFELCRDKRFRRLAAIEQLNQAEQDRIVNELVVSFLVLIMLMLEAPDLRVAADFQRYLADLSKKIPGAHLDYLGSLGIETNALQDWEKLIAMRYEEYARDRHGVRAAAMQIESAERGLDLDGLSRIQMLVPLQAVALGCHVYICRGELDGRNDLFQLTLDSLSKFYVEIRVRVEGGTITPLSRMRAVVKEIIYRMKRRAGKK
jgi:hypothetical protein